MSDQHRRYGMLLRTCPLSIALGGADMHNLKNLPQIQNLSEDEKKVFYNILASSRTNDGLDLSKLGLLYSSDYEEVPVSIDTFLEDDRYLGKVFNNGKGVYPFWRKQLHKIFHENPEYAFEVALTGCLSGDTKIPLLDGTTPTIREMYFSRKKDYEVYSYDMDLNEYTVGKTTDVMFTGVKGVYKITFDNGESVEVTSDHKFLTRDKHWKSVDTGLSVGDSLMPFNRSYDKRGYQQISHPQKDGTSFTEPTHRMVLRYKIGSFKGVVHHKNFNKLDNSTKNLLKSDWWSHKMYHARIGGKQFEDWNTRASIEGSKENLIAKENAHRGLVSRWSDPKQREKAREKMIRFNKDPEFHKKAMNGRSEETRKKNSERLREFNKNHPNIQSLLNKVSKDEMIETLKTLYNYAHLKQIYGLSEAGLYSLLERYEIDPYDYVKKCSIKFPDRYWASRFSAYNKLYTEYGYLDDALVSSNYKAVAMPSRMIKEYFNGDSGEFLEVVANYNHKVVSIEYVGEKDVYDLTVDKHHNFALDCGVVVHNCIGSGKSTIAAIAMMYHMYQVLCLKEPQKYYGLTSNAPIVFVCLNLTLDLAFGGLYSMIVSAIRMSPWFLEKCDVRGRVNYTIGFPHNIHLMCASSVSHVIGRNVKMALMDEINFSHAPKGSQKSVMDMYRNIRRRVESRFMRSGRVYGYIFLISSKNSEQDFLDQYIQTLKGAKSTIVIDEPIWNVKPPETYVGTKFKVAVGDKTKQSRIMSDYDKEDILIEQGYQIIEVPTEYRVAFEQDITMALCDIAGISSVSTSKLIPYAGKIESCINRDRRSPFTTEVIHMGLDSIEDIKDYLDDLDILRKDLHKPRFIHVDIGLKNDMMGIGCVHADSQTTVKKFTPEGNIEELLENTYYVDFAIGIKAIPGSEVPLFKVREFFLWLADVLGYKIKLISYDGFQSSDSLQLLKVAGFDTKLVSVDRTPDPYLNLRSCIIDNRLDMYEHSILTWELYDLEYDKVKNKVDHNPIDGHKDIADSIAASTYNCQLYYAEKHPSQPLQRQKIQRSMEGIRMMNELRRKRNMGIDPREAIDAEWFLRD